MQEDRRAHHGRHPGERPQEGGRHLCTRLGMCVMLHVILHTFFKFHTRRRTPPLHASRDVRQVALVIHIFNHAMICSDPDAPKLYIRGQGKTSKL